MFGIFVFAILLGMIAEEIKRQVERVRSGERQLVLSNHILLLGWNQGVPALLRQVAAAHDDSHNIFRWAPGALAAGALQRRRCAGGRGGWVEGPALLHPLGRG
jgi:hypothetical protein